MADVAPTILHLATGQASAVPAYMDGVSFADQLMAGSNAGWERDTALIEYQSISPDVDTCPTTDKPGKHWHDGKDNTYSAIRIVNNEENLLYAEFVDITNPDAWFFASETINLGSCTILQMIPSCCTTSMIRFQAPCRRLSAKSFRTQLSAMVHQIAPQACVVELHEM